ncbi:MAG TPA: hypothetical protein VHA15_14255 [Burkholderiales bacterium]|jgi:hypothetical protein|nr:hypothetical protein [Burkholderiales bacterium]
MAIDLLAKPVIDALMRALDRARDASLKRDARKAVAEAISELIRIDADVGRAQARIAVAKAAGILDQDLFTAERMLKKVKKAARKPQPARRKPAPRRVKGRRGKGAKAARS